MKKVEKLLEETKIEAEKKEKKNSKVIFEDSDSDDGIAEFAPTHQDKQKELKRRTLSFDHSVF